MSHEIALSVSSTSTVHIPQGYVGPGLRATSPHKRSKAKFLKKIFFLMITYTHTTSYFLKRSGTNRKPTLETSNELKCSSKLLEVQFRMKSKRSTKTHTTRHSATNTSKFFKTVKALPCSCYTGNLPRALGRPPRALFPV